MEKSILVLAYKKGVSKIDLAKTPNRQVPIKTTRVQMSTNVVNILNELATSLGRDLVLEACQKFMSPSSASAKKPKAERKPRGPSPWNLEVQKVLEEMRTAAGADAKITHKMAMEEASLRRRKGNPEAQEKYEASRAKRDASKKGANAEAEPEVTAPAPAEVPKKKVPRSKAE